MVTGFCFQDFHAAVMRALDNVEDTQAQEELRQGLDELPAIHALHQGILQELEQRLGDGCVRTLTGLKGMCPKGGTKHAGGTSPAQRELTVQWGQEPGWVPTVIHPCPTSVQGGPIAGG